jgi:nucleoside-diphosphate-sugar epimerase
MAKLAVTGHTGMLGGTLVLRLQADGHQVTALTRRPATQWDGCHRAEPGSSGCPVPQSDTPAAPRRSYRWA